MVKRVSKKGKNSGQEFWGCKSFPKCRSVVSFEKGN
ncbi:MAG: topoisomerase DNA-binding C4 zinc finger domain-containing protein [Candidatus Aenigmarchaeota archaeon]|nr:topoisomerase DNA-binding C4 zinc finger domain-containing protein [Candidatus Aenigmarchaeota archaeon]